MKILADQNIPHSETFFGQLGQVVQAPGRNLTPEQVSDIDALIVRSVTQVDASLLANSPVKFVGTCTIGTDHLDIPYLNQRQISWASAQGCNANSVVEYVFTALAHVRPNWLNLSVGIIGCGNVGGHLYRKLRQLGVTVRVYDPFLNAKDVPDLTTLEQVLKADIVCVHTPLTRGGPHPTLGLLGAAELATMQTNAVLLNAGRGEVIDGAALAAHLDAQPEFSAVLDVWESEPNIDTALMQRVSIATPHIAGYSYDGKIAGTEMIYQALCAHLGIEPQITAQQVLPANSTVQLCAIETTNAYPLAALLGQAYNILNDDHTLRTALSQAAEQGRPLGPEFDALRKNYPQRREWHHFTQPAGKLADGLSQVLTTLGFK